MDNMVHVTGRKFSCLSFMVVLVLGIPLCSTEARKLATFGEEVLSNLGHNTNGEWIDISKYKRVLNLQIEPSFLAAHFSVNTTSSPSTETFDTQLSSDTPIDMSKCGISSPPLAMLSRLSRWTRKHFKTILSSGTSATTTATPPHNLEISTHNSVATAATFLPKSTSEDFGMFPSRPSPVAPHNEPEPPFAAAATFLPKSRSEDFVMFPYGPSPVAPHNEPEPPFAPIEGQGEYENEPPFTAAATFLPKLRHEDFGMFPSGPSPAAPGHNELKPPFAPIEGQGEYENEPPFAAAATFLPKSRSEDFGMFPSGPSPVAPGHNELEPPFALIEGQGEYENEPPFAAAATFLPKLRHEDFGIFPSGPSPAAPGHNELEPPFAPIEGQGEYENEPSPNHQTTQSPGT